MTEATVVSRATCSPQARQVGIVGLLADTGHLRILQHGIAHLKN
ncbi:hypothetical protein ACWGCW_14405 [Streptomyces sp. NPDC054933]